MILTQFVNTLEQDLNLSSIGDKVHDAATREYLHHDSERIYYGNPLGEVKRVAFMVPPQHELCLRAMYNGYDTLVSHHRWCPKNSQSPRLGDLDALLKSRGMQLLSYHLYWDIARGGIADSIMTRVLDIPYYETLDVDYKGFTIPDLARCARISLSFERLRAQLENNYIRTERFLGHLDWTFNRLIVIPGGGLETNILMPLVAGLEYDPSEKIVIISSGSGNNSGASYLEFFSKYEQNISIIDANHHDLEAIGVGISAKRLQNILKNVDCDMLYADHYINYSI